MSDDELIRRGKPPESALAALASCCLHVPAFAPGDISAVLCCVQRDSDRRWKPAQWTQVSDGIGRADTESYVVVCLKNEFYGLLAEYSDTTGHGCECGAWTNVYWRVSDLLRFGVVEGEARDLVARLLGMGVPDGT